jgi:hypothetical protein
MLRKLVLAALAIGLLASPALAEDKVDLLALNTGMAAMGVLTMHYCGGEAAADPILIRSYANLHKAGAAAGIPKETIDALVMQKAHEIDDGFKEQGLDPKEIVCKVGSAEKRR